jgi:ribonuclease-3
MGFGWHQLWHKVFPQKSFCKAFAELESKIKYKFKSKLLLNEALTHRSFVKENDELPSYERLEFLGDAILGLIVSQYLFEKFPEKSEGELTKIKATLVSETTLNRVAQNLGLGKYLNLSPEEEKSGGRGRASIVADAYEALIGAVYLDGGLKEARRLVARLILGKTKEISQDQANFNYKGELLEYLQALDWGMPRYEIMEEEGPDHLKKFIIAVNVKGKKMGWGEGKNKKEAEQKAAKMALENLNNFNWSANPSNRNDKDNKAL